MKRAMIGIPMLMLSASLMAQTIGHGKVTWVIDGDTYWIQADQRQSFKEVTKDAADNAKRPMKNQFKARILNVDTPESVHVDADRNSTQGKAVSTLVIDELKDQRVQYRCEGVGYYKRPLCSVYLESNGQDYGLSLVQRGLSPYVTRYGRHKENNAGYAAAELEAKRNRLGVWK